MEYIEFISQHATGLDQDEGKHYPPPFLLSDHDFKTQTQSIDQLNWVHERLFWTQWVI